MSSYDYQGLKNILFTTITYQLVTHQVVRFFDQLIYQYLHRQQSAKLLNQAGQPERMIKKKKKTFTDVTFQTRAHDFYFLLNDLKYYKKWKKYPNDNCMH